MVAVQLVFRAAPAILLHERPGPGCRTGVQDGDAAAVERPAAAPLSLTGQKQSRTARDDSGLRGPHHPSLPARRRVSPPHLHRARL
jgi:hypothetical protein